MKCTLLVWCLGLGSVYSTLTYSSLGKEIIDIGNDLRRSLSPLQSQASILLKDFKSFPNNGGKNSKNRAKLSSISEEGDKFFESARRALDGYAFRFLRAALRGYDDRDARKRRILADKRKRFSSKQSRGLISNASEILTDYIVNVLYCTLDKVFKTETIVIISHSSKTTTPAAGGDGATTTPASGGDDITTSAGGGDDMTTFADGGDDMTTSAGGGDDMTTSAGGGGNDGGDGGNSGGVGGTGGGDGGNSGGDIGDIGTPDDGGDIDGGDIAGIGGLDDGDEGIVSKKRKHNKVQKLQKKHRGHSHKTNHH